MKKILIIFLSIIEIFLILITIFGLITLDLIIHELIEQSIIYFLIPILIIAIIIFKLMRKVSLK